MSSRKHCYRPAEGHGLAHDPFNAIVAPRPIGWVSTQDATGILNLAPYSFFNAFNYTPPIVGFCSIGYKDSVRNAKQTGEFCWNLATRSTAEAMNATSASVAPEVDEFQLAGLTPTLSLEVDAPHVGESPVIFECKTSQVITLTTAAGDALDTYAVFGEVVAVHIAPELIVDGIYSTVKAEPILRGGGPADYFIINEAGRFQMRRPG